MRKRTKEKILKVLVASLLVLTGLPIGSYNALANDNNKDSTDSADNSDSADNDKLIYFEKNEHQEVINTSDNKTSNDLEIEIDKLNTYLEGDSLVLYDNSNTVPLYREKNIKNYKTKRISDTEYILMTSKEGYINFTLMFFDDEMNIYAWDTIEKVQITEEDNYYYDFTYVNGNYSVVVLDNTGFYEIRKRGDENINLIGYVRLESNYELDNIIVNLKEINNEFWLTVTDHSAITANDSTVSIERIKYNNGDIKRESIVNSKTYYNSKIIFNEEYSSWLSENIVLETLDGVIINELRGFDIEDKDGFETSKDCFYYKINEEIFSMNLDSEKITIKENKKKKDQDFKEYLLDKNLDLDGIPSSYSNSVAKIDKGELQGEYIVSEEVFDLSGNELYYNETKVILKEDNEFIKLKKKDIDYEELTIHIYRFIGLEDNNTDLKAISYKIKEDKNKKIKDSIYESNSEFKLIETNFNSDKGVLYNIELKDSEKSNEIKKMVTEVYVNGELRDVTYDSMAKFYVNISEDLVKDGNIELTLKTSKTDLNDNIIKEERMIPFATPPTLYDSYGVQSYPSNSKPIHFNAGYSFRFTQTLKKEFYSYRIRYYITGTGEGTSDMTTYPTADTVYRHSDIYYVVDKTLTEAKYVNNSDTYVASKNTKVRLDIEIKYKIGTDIEAPKVTFSQPDSLVRDNAPLNIIVSDEYEGLLSTKYTVYKDGKPVYTSLETTSENIIANLVENQDDGVGEYYVVVTSTDYKRNKAIVTSPTYTIKKDTTKPVIDLTKFNYNETNGVFYVFSKMYAFALDRGSGVSKIYYRYRGEDELDKPYKEYIMNGIEYGSVISDNYTLGISYFDAYSEDVAGNISEVVTMGPLMVVDDITAPIITTSLDGINPIPMQHNELEVDISAFDAHSGLGELKWAVTDSIAFPSSGFTVSDSKETAKAIIKGGGKYYLHISSKDKKPNEAIKTIGPIEIGTDDVFPTMTTNWDGIDYIPMHYNLFTVEVETDDVGSGVDSLQYAFTETSEFPTTNFSKAPNKDKNEVRLTQDGTWYVHLKVLDKGKNTVTKTIGPVELKVDRLSPVVKSNLDSLSIIPDIYFSRPINLTVTDDISGLSELSYSITRNSSRPTTFQETFYFEPYNIDVNMFGTWFVHVEASDNAGNKTYKMYGPMTVLEDKVKPTLTVKAVNALEETTSVLNSADKKLKLQITASDNTSEYTDMMYRVGKEGLFKPLPSASFVETIDYSHLSEGENLEVDIEIRDYSGNTARILRYFLYGVTDKPNATTPDVGSIIELGGHQWIHIGNMNYISKDAMNAYSMKGGKTFVDMYAWLNTSVLKKITANLTEFEKLYLLENDWTYGTEANEGLHTYKGKVGLITKSQYESLYKILSFNNSWTSTLSSLSNLNVWKTYKSNTTELVPIDTNLSVYPVLKLMNGIINSDGGVIMPPDESGGASEEVIEKLKELELGILGIKRVFAVNKLTSGIDGRIWLSVDKMSGLALEVDAGSLQDRVVIRGTEILIDITGLKESQIPDTLTIYATLEGKRVTDMKMFKQEYYYEAIGF